MSEWTVDTLKEHILTLFGEKDRAVQAALAAQKELAQMAMQNAERAVLKAEAATERRFEGVNEFRAQLGDQQRTLMPRQEAELRLNTLDREHDEIKNRLTAIEGKSRGFAGGWAVAVGIAGLLGAVVAIIVALRT